MSKDDTFQQRVMAMVDRAGGVKQLARMLGASDTAIHGWMRGTLPFDSTFDKISDWTPISIKWLRDGDGNGEEELAKIGPDLNAECGARGRLRQALKDAKMTSAELAKRIDIPIGPIQALLYSGARISQNTAEKIVKVLPRLELSDLLEGSETARIFDETGTYGTIGSKPVRQAPPGSKSRAVPLLSFAQAGPDINFEDDTWSGETTEWLDAPNGSFVLKIQGDSMEPKISPGDLVLVCPGWQARNGDTVICRTVRGDVMCKLFQSKFNGQFAILSSYNPAFPPQELSMEEIVWIYPVKDVTKNLRNS